MELEFLISVLGLYASIFYIWYKLGKIEAKVNILSLKLHIENCGENGKTRIQK